MEEILFADNAAVGYHDIPIINNIHISLQKGKVSSLIGPNGSGKSTILKSIAGQIKLLGGTIWLGEKDMFKMSSNEIAQKLSVVLTQRLQTDRLTCRDIVAMGRYPYTGKLGMLSDNDKSKIWEAMELVNILDLSSSDFNEISDGQRQRVLLACAVCQEPEVIVLDEPTSFLDIKHKLELLSLLKKMSYEKQLAIILSIHELELAQKISDWVICVKNGQIEKQGLPNKIFKASYISQLYDIAENNYNDSFGCLEMNAHLGKPDIFVIAGNGSGINTFRKLQREGIPFATGVLHENDIDHTLAKMIATKVVSEKPFEIIGSESLKKAENILKDCKSIICCLNEFGTTNAGNRHLLTYAKNLGIPIDFLNNH